MELEFTSIMDKPGGSRYELPYTEMLTWEYHALCTYQVTGVSLGSTGCSMSGINIPEILDLVNNSDTYHVFVIRAVRQEAVGYSLSLSMDHAIKVR